MSQIYLWELYNRKETDNYYEQHKENIELIQQYHNKGYQGIMANASEILKKMKGE
jgi:outer membrane biogenesis lipoprotein LolB